LGTDGFLPASLGSCLLALVAKLDRAAFSKGSDAFFFGRTQGGAPELAKLAQISPISRVD